MPDFKDCIVINSRLGQIRATYLISSKELAAEKISFKAINFCPRLPSGMGVQICTAVFLALDSNAEISSIEFSLSIESKAVGHSCTGQYLDAQEWSHEGKLVVIGTEDWESLRYRFPMLRDEDIKIVDFTESSLALKLENFPKRSKPSFHFIIAENDDPESVDASAWYAVEQDHRFLLEQLC